MGLMPVEATIMVAIPELDGATGPMVFSGRDREDPKRSFDMSPEMERIDRLADRVHKLVKLRRTAREDRKIGITLFNFPPNSGAMGTAAHLSVFESVLNTLRALDKAGYQVELPESVDALESHCWSEMPSKWCRSQCPRDDSVDDHVTREPYLEEIEAQWGPAPGKHWTDGRQLFVLGKSFGNVFIGVQPAMGYEGDPMRLLFEEGSHRLMFSRLIIGGFARIMLQMPCSTWHPWGARVYARKQVGLSSQCWPDRLIADLPNFYLYAANPSEGLIAKRRSAATLISYLTPPVTRADLHKEFAELRSMTIDGGREILRPMRRSCANC